VIFCAVYAFIFLFGTFYIYRLIRTGPRGTLFETPHLAVPNRPMSLADEEQVQEQGYVIAGE
jgi:cytochrome d ubiquinol oxidase subunit I